MHTSHTRVLYSSSPKLIFLGATHTPARHSQVTPFEAARTPGGGGGHYGPNDRPGNQWANCTPLHCARKAFVGCEHEHAQRLVHLRKVDHNAHSAKKDKLDLI
ncbi:hypothetical protein PC129_g19771 [Phytophthora cactorum]|uniref:Uncharacterized protein n=1 Tax=Phytophthora cactorum TaxID=29920 RepID=A0A8T1H9X0_9STRA|nr:hypothetical protein PC129_g19771 [Phytophthora cactorum]